MWGIVGRNDYLCTQLNQYKEVRMRFLGNIEAKIDTKGRAFLPATFRKVLQGGGDERLVLRKDVFQSFLIPKRYLRMASIEQDIKFIGMGDTIEIWSNTQAEEQQMTPEEFGQALEELMAAQAPSETLR